VPAQVSDVRPCLRRNNRQPASRPDEHTHLNIVTSRLQAILDYTDHLQHSRWHSGRKSLEGAFTPLRVCCLATRKLQATLIVRQRFSGSVAVSVRRLGSVTVGTLDLRSRGRGFDSRSGPYQVVSTWMGDCLRTGKPSRYITNTKVDSAFHPSGVGKSSTGLHGWG